MRLLRSASSRARVIARPASDNVRQVMARFAAALVHRGKPAAAAGLLRVVRAEKTRLRLAAAERRAGQQLMRSRDFAGAEARLRAAITLDPFDAEAQRRLAATLSAQSRSSEAVAVAQRALTRFPDDPAVQAQLGAALLERGDAEGAVEQLKAAASADEVDSRWLRWLVHALARSDRHQEARAVAERLARTAPEDPASLTAAAMVHLDHGDPARAVTWLRRAVALVPGAHTLTALARALLRAGHPDEALDAARRALDIEPGNDSAHATAAEILLAMGRVEEARIEAAEALRLEPDHLHWHILLARILDAAADYEASRDMLQGLSARRWDDPDVQRTVAGYFSSVGNYQRALELARRLVQIECAPRSFVLLADYLQRLKRFDESVEALERALELDPRDAGAMATMAAVLVRQHRIPQAVEQLEAGLELRPDRHAWRLKAASLLIELGELDRAESHLRSILALRPHDPTAREKLARVLLEQGRIQAAEEYIDHTATDPRSAYIAFHSYLAAGQHDGAFSYLAERHGTILSEIRAAREHS